MGLMKRLFSKLRAIRQLPGFHSFCLRRPMQDFEVATMALSAVVYRRNIGPITLFTDHAGMKWAIESGISALYDEVKLIRCNPRINQRVFWAHAKIHALEDMKAPCVSLDIDAVLFRRPPILTDIVALHSEPEQWEVYQPSSVRSDIHRLVDKYIDEAPAKGDALHYPPANTGVLCINDEDFRSAYVTIANHEMIMESLLPSMLPEQELTIEGSPITRMVLTEQYLLSYLAGKMGKNLSFLNTLSVEDDHMAHSPDVMHLWNSKRFYMKHGRARDAYLSWVMENLWILGQNKRGEISRIVRACNLPCYRINDGNTRSVRWSNKGEWNGPGEEVNVF